MGVIIIHCCVYYSRGRWSRGVLASKMEENAKLEANKLVNLIDNVKELKRLRDEHKFTLEILKKEKEIELSDCHKL